MHVKQVTTSQAFKWNPEKQLCVSRRKSFTRSSLSFSKRRPKSRRPAGLVEVTGQFICIFHKSIATRYCLRNSRASVRLAAGLTRTPTERNATTTGGLVIAMCFQMVCYGQWTTGLRHTILNKLSLKGGERGGQTHPSPFHLHTQHVFARFNVIGSGCGRGVFLLFFFVSSPQITTFDTPRSREMECVRFPPTESLSVTADSTVSWSSSWDPRSWWWWCGDVGGGIPWGSSEFWCTICTRWGSFPFLQQSQTSASGSPVGLSDRAVPTLLPLHFSSYSPYSAKTPHRAAIRYTHRFIFHKEKQKKIKQSSLITAVVNAQQASSIWPPDRGAPGGVQLGLGCCHCSEGGPLPGFGPACRTCFFSLCCSRFVIQKPTPRCPAHRSPPSWRALGSQRFYRSGSGRGTGLHPATGRTHRWNRTNTRTHTGGILHRWMLLPVLRFISVEEMW